MSDETKGLSRRRFLGGAVVLACAGPLEACAPEDPKPIWVGPWMVPVGATLEPDYYAILAALFDALLPASPPLPGATATHAAWYLDQLLGAFKVYPPRIYAGGPYSGRHGGDDGFSQFQPLTRIEELRWRLYLEGSMGIPEREFNGPVKGLIETYGENLDLLDREAKARFKRGFAFCSLEQRQELVGAHDGAFVELAYGHAVEGTYGDPVYGGNFERKGWAGISYEGDRQPVGYSASQMANPEEE